MISRQTFPTAELLNNFLTANDGKWYGLVEPGGFQWVVVSMDGYAHAANDFPEAVDIELLDYPVEVEELVADDLSTDEMM